MSDQHERLDKKQFLLMEAEGSLVGPAGTSGAALISLLLNNRGHRDIPLPTAQNIALCQVSHLAVQRSMAFRSACVKLIKSISVWKVLVH
jgi:hypothetical protein